MPFPLDPTFQLTGPPFLTAPDGTTAPDFGGTEVDLTGVPLTVAPASNAKQTGDSATISAFVAGVLTVTGLHDIAPESVGRVIGLDGTNPGNRGFFTIVTVLSSIAVEVADAGGVFPDVNNGAVATISAFGSNRVTLTGLTGMRASDVGRDFSINGAANAGNNGTFTIVQVIDATSVVVADSGGVFPDANSGGIFWSTDVVPSAWTEFVDLADFPPGDPLTILVEDGSPFYYNQQTFGPPRGGGAVILPVNQNVPPDNSQSAATGKNDPQVRPTGGTRGPVVFTDPQNPVRLELSRDFITTRDINSLAFGQTPGMQDGPSVRTPSKVVAVPAAGVTAEKFKDRGTAYPVANPVVFSRS